MQTREQAETAILRPMSVRGASHLTIKRSICEQDFAYFLEHVRIVDVHKGVIPYELWPHLLEMAREWGMGLSQIVLKARQLGVSWLLACFMLWKTMYHANARVLAISKLQLDSDELLNKARQVYELLPDWAVVSHVKSNVSTLSFVNGATILALPSTRHAGRGFTASTVIVDESHFHVWASENFKAYFPTIGDGGQLLMVSTANGTSGLFYDQFEGARSGKTGLSWKFIPFWSRPNRQEPRVDSAGQWLDDRGRVVDVLEQAEQVASEAWYNKTEAAFPGMPAEFRQEYPRTIAEAWTAQTGLVYGLDNDGVAIFSKEQHPRGNLSVDPCAWEDCLWHFAGVDWGGGDPTAVGVWGVLRSGRIHQFAEFHGTGPISILQIGEFLLEWTPAEFIDERLMDTETNVFGVAAFWDSIECGKDESVSIASLNALGFPAHAADTGRREGFGECKELLKSRRMTFNERCEYTLLEFDSYRWAKRADTEAGDRYATADAFNRHGDHKDEMRYVARKITRMELSPVDYSATAYELTT